MHFAFHEQQKMTILLIAISVGGIDFKIGYHELNQRYLLLPFYSSRSLQISTLLRVTQSHRTILHLGRLSGDILWAEYF